MSERTAVSVVIPVYNGAATIARAVESALAQRTDRPLEVIAVNDGSTDATAEILARFGERIHVVSQPNLGLAAARNTGARAARGDLIALLDADDVWEPDKVAATVPVLESNPACVAVFSDAVQVDAADNVVIAYFVPPAQAHAPTLDEMLAQVWMIQPSTVVIRRAALLEVGGFPEAFGPRGYGGEDVFTMLLLRERGEIRFVPKRLVRYRLSDARGNIVKRLRRAAPYAGGRPAQSDLHALFDGYGIFARLVRERYGTRGRTLARGAIETKAGGLVSLGLSAMHEGNRALARRCYLASLRYRMFDAKTWLRLAWSTLPPGMTHTLAAWMSPRLRRSLSGPPFHILLERPD